MGKLTFSTSELNRILFNSVLIAASTVFVLVFTTYLPSLIEVT